MGKSFPITVWSGLVSTEHREKMGSAIWLYLLFIDWITKEKDDKGLVLGGKPITYDEVHDRIGISSRQYNRYLKRLSGYIETTRTPNGYSIKILKSKKRKRKIKVPKMAPLLTVNGTSDMPKMAPQGTKNGRSNIRQYKDNTVDITKTPKDVDKFSESNVAMLFKHWIGEDQLMGKVPTPFERKVFGSALKHMPVEDWIPLLKKRLEKKKKGEFVRDSIKYFFETGFRSITDEVKEKEWTKTPSGLIKGWCSKCGNRLFFNNQKDVFKSSDCCRTDVSKTEVKTTVKHRSRTDRPKQAFYNIGEILNAELLSTKDK